MTNNDALQQALRDGYRIVPVIILDPVILGSDRLGNARRNFYFRGLQALQGMISHRGGTLVIRSGPPGREIPRLVEELRTERVYAERDYSPYARSRDRKLRDEVGLQLVPGLTIAAPDQILTNAGHPYQVYSYYRKKWKAHFFEALRSHPEPDLDVRFSDRQVDSERLSGDALEGDPGVFIPGEQAAREHLKSFLGGEDPTVYHYQVDRDRPDRSGTSRLSPYLHFGMISVREVFQAGLEVLDRAVNQAERQSVETWLDELIWREFFQMILYHHPGVLRGSYRKELDSINWRNNQEEFDRWKQGLTGYPLVDAGMRQLLAEGWMHNRVRMVAGSFLVKDLLIDWRWGESWFMERLVDADLAANNGGWQWVAGTGTDAAPYFRVFNPSSQAEKHDPEGRYIRNYVPELRAVPDRYIHRPWSMPSSLQEELDFRIGEVYPAPIVDHQQARERTLEAYQLAREIDEPDNLQGG